MAISEAVEEEEDVIDKVASPRDKVSCVTTMYMIFQTVNWPFFQKQKANIFDNLPALAPPKPSDLGSELDQFLKSDVENVTDAIAWWYEKWLMFPLLSRMALDYLSIPGEY